MKKLLALLLAMLMCIGLAACKPSNKNKNGSSSAADTQNVSGTLVIYTTTYDIEYKLIIEEGFQKKYPNVKVETVQAGAGELKTRIKSEIENPQGDVMFGGLAYSDASAPRA